VPGFEREVTFRLLLVSGNYALCENKDGPLRIPSKDFAAACEAGELVEVPEDDR
jgi:predicted small lipoprotein YifL